MSNKVPLNWNILKKCDELFEYMTNRCDFIIEYMTNNFNSMFDGNKIKHFYIVDGIRGTGNTVIDIDELIKAHIEDIQKVLVPWIKKEYEEKRLFVKENWKPFRESYVSSSIYFGYRKMFLFRNCYTQIRLVSACQVEENCEYCMKNVSSISFYLGVYGWKDEICTTLRPYKCIPIPDSETMLMPECIWGEECDT